MTPTHFQAFARSDGAGDRPRRVRGWIDSAERIVALTGAGISTGLRIRISAGRRACGRCIRRRRSSPTPLLCFRSGDPQLSCRAGSTIRRGRRSPISATARWRVERRGKLHALIHAEHRRAACARRQLAGARVRGARQRAPGDVSVLRLARSMQDVLRACARRRRPAVRGMRGISRATTISFGQALIPEVIEGRCSRGRSDLLLAWDRRVQVYPVAGRVPLAKDAGARIVIMNAQPTASRQWPDAVLTMSIGEALPFIRRLTPAREPARAVFRE